MNLKSLTLLMLVTFGSVRANAQTVTADAVPSLESRNRVVATWKASGEAMTWNAGVAYAYDGAGNIRTIGADPQLYDAVGRLIQSDINGSRQSYTYDGFGNRLTCTASGTDCQYGYTVNSVENKNRMSSVTYSAAGNVTGLGSMTVVYDSLNMPVKKTIGAVNELYVYTADEERIAVYDAVANWRWTIRDVSGKVLREVTSQNSSGGALGSSAWAWSKDYVYRDGALLASVQPNGGSPSTYHYHLDHLGTPRRITDNADAIIGIHDYYAFGPETAGGTNEPSVSRLKFTGHERDLSTAGSGVLELDYMHARYYAGAMGRFLSVDPGRDWNLHQPQSWNMYAYVRNNPINTVDPTGKWGWSDFKQWVGDRGDALSNWWREKWHKDIPAPADQYGAVEALEDAGYSQAEAQEIGNPQARWANARAEAGAIISDEASREIATQVAMSAIGGIVVKGLSREALMLRKALASEAQMAEEGIRIAGTGTRTVLRDTPRLAATYGGEAADWVKMRSSSYTAADGVRFETHWYQNIRTGERAEFKTKFQ
ncbi:MAG: RHS repeat domain-containing protein [Thermoanaerobaculia bacterium]